MGPAFSLTIGGNYCGPGESSLTLVSLPAKLAGGGSRIRQSPSLPFKGPSVVASCIRHVAAAITGNFSAVRSLQRQPTAARRSSLSPLSPLTRGACRFQMARNRARNRALLPGVSRRIELIAKIGVTSRFGRFGRFLREDRETIREHCAPPKNFHQIENSLTSDFIQIM